MRTADLIQNSKYSNCADLNAPELFVILDFIWAKFNMEAITNTKGVEGFSITLGWFYIDDPNDRLLFALRWP